MYCNQFILQPRAPTRRTSQLQEQPRRIIMQQQPPPVIILQQRNVIPESYMVLSVIATVFNPVLGWIGILMSYYSKTAAAENRLVGGDEFCFAN